MQALDRFRLPTDNETKKRDDHELSRRKQGETGGVMGAGTVYGRRGSRDRFTCRMFEELEDRRGCKELTRTTRWGSGSESKVIRDDCAELR